MYGVCICTYIHVSTLPNGEKTEKSQLSFYAATVRLCRRMGVQRFMYVHMHEDEDEDERGSESIGIKKINLHPTNRLYHVEWYICM